MSYEAHVRSIFKALKHNTPCESDSVIPVRFKSHVVAHLRVVTVSSCKDPEEIRLFAKWRKRNERWFPSQFRVTITGTKRWAREQLIDKEDRILFMIEDLSGKRIGHVGLNRFDWKNKSCEIDNIIRGEAGIPGLMTSAITAMCGWGVSALGVRSYYLQCFPNNTKAMALYRRCGFTKVGDAEHGMIRMKKTV